jgi:hypothetical protein
MRALATNLSGVVETPTLDGGPYRIDLDGRPYVPIGDGGVVLGVRLGDSVFATDADHAAPGACLVHAEQDARHALVSYACLGNAVLVRSGLAAGSRGVVLGKRGELGRVIACFADDVLDRVAPGDAVQVRGYGQGAGAPTALAAGGAVVMNASPAGLALLPIEGRRVGVRAVLPSAVVGNGIGRPVEQWDVDLSITAATGPDLRLGDLVAITDLDVRHNAGYRRGFVTVGIVVHGASPQPGHGPGVMPVLCGPAAAFELDVQADDHRGVTLDALLAVDDRA